MITTNLYLDNESLGPKMQLVDVRADMYLNGQRQDTAHGYVYDVVLPSHKYDHLAVHISGDVQLEAPSTMQTIMVEFDELRVRPYVDRSGRLALTATAKSIRQTKSNISANSSTDNHSKS